MDAEVSSQCGANGGANGGAIGGATVVAPPAGERTLIRLGFPVAGAGVAWLLKLAAGWVAGLPWAPFQGPFELVASVPEPIATVGALVVGVVAGLVLVYLAEGDYVIARVGDDEVTLTKGGSSTTVLRASVSAVFLDGKQLVVLGRRTEELLRLGGDVKAASLAAAFEAHRYPWREEGDPHRDAYRRWVDGLPDLPAGADALFRARGRALERDDTDDADQLREELGGMGVVVRDVDKRQHWRLVD